MDSAHYDEMRINLDMLIQKKAIQNRHIYLFGHCHATEELVAMLYRQELPVAAILDNNKEKQGQSFCGIAVKPPEDILSEPPEQTTVCIVARAYAAMCDQLQRMGYQGTVYQLVNYNSYAEYSLSEDTVNRMYTRMERGWNWLNEIEREFPDHFRILCPFSALGDIYIMMSYLTCFLEKRGIKKCVVVVIGNACTQVVRLFGSYAVKTLSQTEMDEVVQAALFTKDANTFVAHQDRPYVVKLHNALYKKVIPLEQMYCCGVFGLPASTRPHKPVYENQCGSWEGVHRGEAVVISPYAKSVPALPDTLWMRIVDHFSRKGVQCFTNAAGEERPLPGTEPLRLPISHLASFVEWAGTFIGIRSGICDVLKEADCRKIALYPDYNYSDTRWKAIDIYYLDGWENHVIREDFQWNQN